MPRRTKIVCTLGPATEGEERVEALLRAGMDVARINFSHGTLDEHERRMAEVRAVAKRLGRPVAVLQDLQGPKIRTGPLAGGAPVALKDGDLFTITSEPLDGDAARISTTYAALTDDVVAGDRILLSDGAIELRVESVKGAEVRCRVVYGGVLAEHQGINLPGVAVSAPALTEKDKVDLVFGVRHRVDYIALSFVRRAEDLHEARQLIATTLAESSEPPQARVEGLHPSAYAAETTIPLIAKLEKPEAIEHLDDILRVADGVMVARGDLGVEMPLEQVPLVQKRVIARANAFGLPVITATQMLESMIHSPRPTRAEASDVANAILDGTDAVMLSGETAVGQFPIEAVRVMARIAEETDGHWSATPTSPAASQASRAHAVSAAARTLAEQAHAKLIVVFTRTGASAHLISKERPDAAIVAYTPFETVYRRLALWWGVQAHPSELQGDTEELIAWVDGRLREGGLAVRGDDIVIVGGMPVAGHARTNFVKLHRVGES
jgi:pyruvate kinase